MLLRGNLWRQLNSEGRGHAWICLGRSDAFVQPHRLAIRPVGDHCAPSRLGIPGLPPHGIPVVLSTPDFEVPFINERCDYYFGLASWPPTS